MKLSSIFIRGASHWKPAVAAFCVSFAPFARGQNEPVDIAGLLASGRATVAHTAIDIGPIGNIFDGQTNSLARTPGINPMTVTLSFTTPKELTGSGVWFLAGANRWRIETADTLADLDAATGSFRVPLDWQQGPEVAWNDRLVAAPVTCSVIRLKIQRLTGDAYVHLNEWRLMEKKRSFQVTDCRESDGRMRLTWNSSFGRWYEVQFSPDLKTWSSSGYAKGGEGITSYLAERPFQERCFFRIREALAEERPAITKRVLVLNIDPLIESHGGRRLNSLMGWNDSKALNVAYLADLNTASGGYVNWEVAHWIDLDLWPVKNDGFAYDDASYLAAWSNGSFHQPDSIDYAALLDRALPELGGRSIHQVAAAGEVDEVICWAFPYSGFYESQMVGGTAYWCNSPPIIRPSPLYVVMGLNPERGVAEALHSFGHRSESILSHVYGSWSGGSTVNHLWDRFTQVGTRAGVTVAGCGNIHYPPNGASDYDYANLSGVVSEADRWLAFPNLVGPTSSVNAAKWGGPDYQRNFLRWWYARLPKAPGRYSEPGNAINHGKLNNWWAYLVDMNEYAESR